MDNDDHNEKIFNDPIHGTMEIPEICVQIIDTPQFQRLRNIKQLGGNYYVYPGACHNRFEHSIGVCHLAGKQFIQLVTKQPGLYGDDERSLKEKHLKCVQIAGLCHDLGHGPYSHVFQDLFLPAVGRVGQDSWKHEDGSKMMFQHMLAENSNIRLEPDEQELILHMILPKTKNQEEEAHFVALANDKTFLYQIVSNNETGIDVDKFDYLARDCHHLGLRNSFDSERLMKLARVKRGKISYPIKEIEGICSLFQARSSLHRKAYKHRTAKCIEQMLTDAMLLVKNLVTLRGNNGCQVPLEDCVDDPVAYSLLDDSIINTIKQHEIVGDTEGQSGEDAGSDALVQAHNIIDRVVKDYDPEDPSLDLEDRKGLARVMKILDGVTQDDCIYGHDEKLHEAREILSGVIQDVPRDDYYLKQIIAARKMVDRKLLSKAKEILHRVDKRKLYRPVGEFYAYNEDDTSRKFDEDKIREAVNAKLSDLSKTCVIHVVKFNSGQKGRNPVLFVPFFPKKKRRQDPEPDRLIDLTEEDLPPNEEVFKEKVVVRIYSMSQEDDDIENSKEALAGGIPTTDQCPAFRASTLRYSL